MIVGFHSPLPPVRSGVADYAQTLLEALRSRAEVRVGAERADVDLYQIGNNQLHAQVYTRALARPGVVVLHDAVLHHFFLGSLSREHYIEEFTYNYGEWHRQTAAELWERRARSAVVPEYFRYPMLRRLAETAHAVVVHNPDAARIVAEHAPAARIYEIPHLFAPRAAAQPRSRRIFGVLGYLRETKRLSTVLRAFRRVYAAWPDARLVIAGDITSPDLARAIGPLLDSPGVIRRPWLSDADFWATAESLNTCINLRYPAAGETSGITIRLMGIGRAVILSDSPANARYPEATCIRIDTGIAEREMLEHAMMWLCAVPDTAREIGARAARYIRERHSFEAVAGQYMRVLSVGRNVAQASGCRRGP